MGDENKKVRRFATRTIKNVPLTFENENRERVTENFDVVYHSYSKHMIEDLQQSFPDGETIPYSTLLGKYVYQIIDSNNEPLTGDDGQPADFSNGFFDYIDINEAKALYERIETDIYPQKASPDHGPSGSNPAASEA